VELTPVTDIPIDGLSKSGWRIGICTPGMEACDANFTFTLQDSQGLAYVRDL
jgi:hypothetical protein